MTSHFSAPSSRRDNCDHDSHRESKSHFVPIGIALAGFGFGIASLYGKDQDEKHSTLLPFKSVCASSITPGAIRKDLPTYSAAQVAEHDTKEKGIWVYYGNGVYDITEFVEMHPGGKKILMAAGKDMSPFWALYAVHNTDEVYEMLESYRIGNITEVPPKAQSNANDPYRNDPERSPLLIPSSKKPYNAEPPVSMLTDRFLTPNDLFYVRNHLPVPDVKLEDYKLTLCEGSTNEKSLSFDELKGLPKRCVTCVTQCAGNRRSEMVKVKPVKGLNWGHAAISNAKWSGVCLDDLLKQNGIDIDKVKGKHIVFDGMDTQPDGSVYGASIPLELARNMKKDIIIAYEMNNKPIPRDHGFPVRVICPGIVGARHIKWLNKIYFSNEESTCHWQRSDYKGFNSSVDWDNVNFDNSVSINELPVTSAICEPEEGAVLDEGSEEVFVKGYAWSGGGRAIIRVDISADGGKTWEEARLKPNGQSPYKSFAWTLWEADVKLPKGATKTQLVVKAVDISYNVQPDSVEGIWNLRGCLSNAWHRININIPEDSES